MDCISFYEKKLVKELQRKDLIIINMERLLDSIEKSIADVKDKKETTPYAGVSGACDSVLSALYEEKRSVEEKIEDYLYSIAPSATTLIGYRILAKMLAHSGSLRALAFMPASRLQIMGAEKGLFSGKEKREGDEIELGGEKKDRKTPKHGYIFQHPLVKGEDKKSRGKSARKLACSLAIALRKDYFSLETEIGSRLEPGKMYSDETLKPPRARTNEKSKLFYLFKIRPEL
ncbi:MAG: hypothetical protein SVE93_03925, partial [Candidatus Thermoplasmatota archaeon]|nr:hypothetical protein [Candidatus Thermoplasmatota archaeon]